MAESGQDSTKESDEKAVITQLENVAESGCHPVVGM
jgi:hypothetical protein